jgi:hypothetical protein
MFGGMFIMVEAAAAHSHRRNNRRPTMQIKPGSQLPGHVRNYTCLLNLTIKIKNQLNPCCVTKRKKEQDNQSVILSFPLIATSSKQDRMKRKVEQGNLTIPLLEFQKIYKS